MSDDDPSAPDAPDAVTADEAGAVTADPTDPDPLPGEPPAPLRPTDLVMTRGARRVRIALAVLLVLAAGLLVGRLTAGGDDAAETDEDTQATAGEELPFPSGDQNRTDYWAYAGLDPTVIDTFDRPDSPNDLGVTGTGQPWESVSGTWGVGDDRALSGGGSGDEPLLAVVPEGTGDGLTEVTMIAVEEGAGLVFRYQDPENYWSVTANPGPMLLWAVIIVVLLLIAATTGFLALTVIFPWLGLASWRAYRALVEDDPGAA